MKIQVCTWKLCKERWSEYILKRLESDKKMFNLDNVFISNCACMWHCKEWPNVMFDKHLEHHSDPARASKMMMDKIKWKVQTKQKFTNSSSEDDNNYNNYIMK